MSSKPIVYIDSSIFLGWLYGKQQTVTKTQIFLSKISAGTYEGVISTLVLNEMIKVIRKKLVERGQTNKTDWDHAERKALESVFKIKGLSVKKGEPHETNSHSSFMTFGKISSEALAIMKKYPGKISPHYKSGKPMHDGISPVDSYHIVLAKRFQCNNLVTLDNDFKETSLEILPMVI